MTRTLHAKVESDVASGRRRGPPRSGRAGEPATVSSRRVGHHGVVRRQVRTVGMMGGRLVI